MIIQFLESNASDTGFSQRIHLFRLGRNGFSSGEFWL
jgi:hypothetical protein